MPVCVFFLGNQCRYGDQCKFSHGTQPVVEQVVCPFYLQGSCLYGTRCNNLHPASQRQRTFDLHSQSKAPLSEPKFLCKFFPLGRCKNGSECPYVHIQKASVPAGSSGGTNNAHGKSFGRHGTPAEAMESPPAPDERAALSSGSRSLEHQGTNELSDSEAPLCKYFADGRCNKGSKCCFRHVSPPNYVLSPLNADGTEPVTGFGNWQQSVSSTKNDDLSSTPPVEQQKPKVTPDANTDLCKYFASGSCARGDACAFRHGGAQFFTNSTSTSPFVPPNTSRQASLPDSLNNSWRPRKPCKFFASGTCFRGDVCTFLHDTEQSYPSESTNRHWSDTPGESDEQSQEEAVAGSGHWADAVPEDDTQDAAPGWGNDDADNSWGAWGSSSNNGASSGWGEGNSNDNSGETSEDGPVAVGWGESAQADWGEAPEDLEEEEATGWGDGTSPPEEVTTAQGQGEMDFAAEDSDTRGWGVSDNSGWGSAGNDGWGSVNNASTEAIRSQPCQQDNLQTSSDQSTRALGPSRFGRVEGRSARSAGVCYSFLKGSCQRGTKCRFLHERNSEERACALYLEGRCRDGAGCQLSHDIKFKRSDLDQPSRARRPPSRQRDGAPHIKPQPSWTHILKPDDPNAARVDPFPSVTVKLPNSGFESPHASPLNPEGGSHSTYTSPPGIPTITPAPSVTSTGPLSPRLIMLPPSPPTPHLVPLPLSPASPRLIPLPSSPLLFLRIPNSISPHSVPLPLSPVSPLPAPLCTPDPPLSTSDLDDAQPDPETHRDSIVSIDGDDEVQPPPAQEMTTWGNPPIDTYPGNSSAEVCRLYARHGYCDYGDNCRFLHDYDGPPTELAERSPATDNVTPPSPTLSSPRPTHIEPDPLFLEMDTEPMSTTRPFYGATVRFGHRGVPTNIVTAYESPRITLSNLPFHVSPNDIRLLVARFGHVTGLMVFEPTAERPSVSALVEFSCSDEADAAAAQLDDTWYQRVRISAQPDRRGTVESIGDDVASRYVRLSWNPPSKVAWAYYDTITKAKAEAAKLSTIKFERHPIKATFERPRKSQKSAFAIKITGLPLDTDRRRLQEFCVGSTSVTVGESTYADIPTESIRELLARHGRLKSLKMLPQDLDSTKCVAIAQFSSSEAASSAAQALDNYEPEFLGHGKLTVQHVFVSIFLVPRRHYVAIKEDLDHLSQGLVETTCRIYCYDRLEPIQVHVCGADSNSFNSARGRVERLILGKVVHSENKYLWSPYLETEHGARLLDNLNKDPRFFIRADIANRRLYALGSSPDRRRAQESVKALLSKLAKSCHSLPVRRQVVGPLLSGELETLRTQFPSGRLILDVIGMTLTVWGKSETVQSIRNTLRKLEYAAPTICALPYDQIVCPSCWRPPAEAITIPCGHTYCTPCLRHLILSLGESPEGVRCIGQVSRDEDGDDAVICNHDVPFCAFPRVLNVDPEEGQLLKDAFASFVRDPSNGLAFCPSPGCDFVYRRKGSGVVLACPSCSARICPSCEVYYHEGISCDQYAIFSPHV